MKTILRWLPATLLLLIFALFWRSAVSGGISGMTAWLTLISALPFLGGLTLLGVVALFVWKRKITAPLVVTFLVSLLVIWPFLWQFNALTVSYPSSLDEVTPAATVRLPVDEPLLVNWGGDTPRVNYHAISREERWAYDFVIEPALSESNRLEDYGCWGVPIVAPAAGEIVIAQDGHQDYTPGERSGETTYPAGNHVAIRLATDTYLLISHLQNDSIVVSPGQQVVEGQPLGKCGNSGNTTEPHIHIHHQREEPGILAPGMAEGLPLYFRDHAGLPMPQGGVRREGGRLVAFGDTVQHIGR